MYVAIHVKDECYVQFGVCMWTTHLKSQPTNIFLLIYSEYILLSFGKVGDEQFQTFSEVVFSEEAAWCGAVWGWPLSCWALAAHISVLRLMRSPVSQTVWDYWTENPQ